MGQIDLNDLITPLVADLNLASVGLDAVTGHTLAATQKQAGVVVALPARHHRSQATGGRPLRSHAEPGNPTDEGPNALVENAVGCAAVSY